VAISRRPPRTRPGADTESGPLVVQATAAVVAAAAGAVALYLFHAWLLGITPHPEI